MQSVQESKQELEASIRYAENAISSAKATIESMDFRQEMAKKQYTEQTGREEALTKQVQELEERVKFYDKQFQEMTQGVYTPTMPVIPKDVAIAIFREGIKQGVCDVCDELDNTNDIEIEESGYTGGFEVSFSKYIDLSDHLDLDWMRGNVGDYDEASVIEALKNLCAEKEFECRIHGVDDQGNDSKSA